LRQAEIVKGKYDGNTIEIDCALPARRGGLREIIKGNTMEIQ
jgi:hypothetical protein